MAEEEHFENEIEETAELFSEAAKIKTEIVLFHGCSLRWLNPLYEKYQNFAHFEALYTIFAKGCGPLPNITLKAALRVV